MGSLILINLVVANWTAINVRCEYEILVWYIIAT